MKARFTLFQRGGVYYSQDTTTGKQHSLRTKDECEALALLHSKNEAHRQPNLNLQIARTYLTATDPEVAIRTWQVVMNEMTKTKTGSTLSRYERAMADRAFDVIRALPILETNAIHFLRALEAGSVATNVFLRRIQNFALDLNWLPWPVLPKKRWPAIRFNEKRAITLVEHQAIISRERNSELSQCNNGAQSRGPSDCSNKAKAQEVIAGKTPPDTRGFFVLGYRRGGDDGLPEPPCPLAEFLPQGGG